MGCSKKDSNPFYNEYDTPFKTPPFAQVKMEHYMPTFTDGIAQETKGAVAIQTVFDFLLCLQS